MFIEYLFEAVFYRLKNYVDRLGRKRGQFGNLLQKMSQ